MTENNLPAWFRRNCDDFREAPFFQEPQAASDYLCAAQSHIYDTYASFNAQVRSVFLFSLGAVGIAAALIGLLPNQTVPTDRGLVFLGAGVSLLMFLPLSFLALRTMKERYRIYVAAVLHAAYCHYAAGVPCHPWFDWLEDYLGQREVEDVRTLTEYWIKTPPNAFLPYKWATVLLALVMALAGSGLIVAGARLLLFA